MKRVFRWLGLISAIIGIFIIIIQPFISISGAVIDISSIIGQVWFIVGLGFLIAGAVFFIYSHTLEQKVLGLDEIDVDEMIERINEIESDKNKIALIADTSSVLEKTPAQVERLFKTYNGRVFVPDSAIEEIKYAPLKHSVETNSSEIEGFERYKKTAESYLKRTDKPRMYGILAPILDSLDIFEGKRKVSELSSKELQLINKNTELLKKLAKRDKFDMRGMGVEGIKKTREYLEKHCRLSEADVDVLANALKAAREKYQGKQTYHAIVAQKDIDFTQAIDLIKQEHPKIGVNIDYVDLYAKKTKEKVA